MPNQNKESIREKSQNPGWWIGERMGWLLVPLFLYLLATCLVTIGYWGHRVAGFIASAAVIIFSLLQTLGFRKAVVEESRKPALFALSLFSQSLVCALAGFASLAYGLHSIKADLHPSFRSVFTVMSAFNWQFLWHLIDMVPGIKVWETLKIDDPITTDDFSSRICVLLFQIAVVLPFIALIKTWLDLRKSTPNANPGESKAAASVTRSNESENPVG